jgi:hypothetical protein
MFLLCGRRLLSGAKQTIRKSGKCLSYLEKFLPLSCRYFGMSRNGEMNAVELQIGRWYRRIVNDDVYIAATQAANDLCNIGSTLLLGNIERSATAPFDPRRKSGRSCR